MRCAPVTVPLFALVACDGVADRGVGPDCAYAMPRGEAYSAATDPDCTGVAVLPDPSDARGFDPAEPIWVVDVTGRDGGAPSVDCAFTPRPGNCPLPELAPDEAWSVRLGGHGSAVGTEHDCLCADVVCRTTATGRVLRSWTWELGRCAL